MDIIISTVASVATTIITVLGAIYYLDRKIESNRRELMEQINGTRQDVKDVRQEVKDVLQASNDAHTSIRADLAEVRIEQARQNERLKCIETHLSVKRPED